MNMEENLNNLEIENDQLVTENFVDKYRTLLYLGASAVAVATGVIDARIHEPTTSIAFDGAAAGFFLGAAIYYFVKDNPTINPED